MKIAVLEWSCGGGLQGAAASHTSEGLLREGWQMLKNLVDGLAEAGMEVLAPLDSRSVPPAPLHGLVQIVELSHPAATTTAEVIRRWEEIASECDYVWVIAPEIDGLLPHILERLRSAGHQLLNCYGEFLDNCTDKRLTSAALAAAGIAHPPTIEFAEIDDAWLAATAQVDNSGDPSLGSPRWIIKPAAGAGGAEQRLVTREQLLQPLHSAAVNRLVQPWLPGHSASCTAIVDAQGKRHWLPLVSQDFWELDANGRRASSRATANEPTALPPQYAGCTYPCAELPQAAPRALLEATLDALGPGAYGPVGIDLLFNPLTHTWTVIEANARCTSSLLAMASAYRGNLVRDIFHLLTGSCDVAVVNLSQNVNSFQFRVAGK